MVVGAPAAPWRPGAIPVLRSRRARQSASSINATATMDTSIHAGAPLCQRMTEDMGMRKLETRTREGCIGALFPSQRSTTG